MERICENCGGSLSEAARFCPKCGTEQIKIPVQDTRSGSTKRANAGRPPKKKGGAVSAVAALLILVVFFSWIAPRLPWPEKPAGTTRPPTPSPPSDPVGYASTRLTEVVITEADLNVQGTTAVISRERPEATVNGATVAFGAYNVLEEATLTVKRLAPKVDEKNGFAIEPYDFSLEDRSTFMLPVKVEMSYYPVFENDSWEEGNIFVQYFNSSTGDWELMVSEVDAEKNTAIVYTDHFCTFAVFQDTEAERMEGGGLSLFRYDGPRYTGPRNTVHPSGVAIREYLAHIDDSLYQKFIDTKTVSVQDATSICLGVDVHLASGPSHFLVDPTTKAGKVAQLQLTTLGSIVALSKIAYQWHRGVATEDILLDNAFNLTEMALTGTSLALGAPELATAAAAVWTAGFVYDVGTFGYEWITENESRYVAYKKFSEWSPVYYVPNLDTCMNYMDYIELDHKTGAGSIALYGVESEWAKAFNLIQEKHKNDPRKITAALKELLESYLGVFWNTDGSIILDFLKQQPAGLFGGSTMADGWVWPTVEEEAQYKAAYRHRMKEFLRPVMKAMAHKMLLELEKHLVKAVCDAEPVLNNELEFEIRDKNLQEGQFFLSSPFASMHITLEPLEQQATPREWICAERQEKSNTVFCCTVYNYLKAGSPRQMAFWEPGSGGMMTLATIIGFEVSDPKTTVVVGDDAEIGPGIYAGSGSGKTVLGETFGDLLYPSIRIARTDQGLLIGPCLEDGSYDPNWQVGCVPKPGTDGWVTGTRRVEDGKSAMTLVVDAYAFGTGARQRVTVMISQTLHQYALTTNYSWDVELKGALAGESITGQASIRSLRTKIQ